MLSFYTMRPSIQFISREKETLLHAFLDIPRHIVINLATWSVRPSAHQSCSLLVLTLWCCAGWRFFSV